MTKDAIGRMKHLANGRDQLAGMSFPSLAFTAWFCDCSVTHFWNCEMSFVGVHCLAVIILQSAWSLPRRPREPKHNHHWVEGNGRITWDWGKGYQEGAEVLALWIFIFRKHCFCLVVFFAYLVWMSLTQQSLQHGVPLAPGDGRVTSHVPGIVLVAIMSFMSAWPLKSFIVFPNVFIAREVGMISKV